MFYFLADTGVVEVGLTGSLLVVILSAVFGIISFILGIYLIRRGIVYDSILYCIVGIILTHLFIGLIIYIFSKNSPTLLKERKKYLRNKLRKK